MVSRMISLSSVRIFHFYSQVSEGERKGEKWRGKEKKERKEGEKKGRRGEGSSSRTEWKDSDLHEGQVRMIDL